MLLAVDVGNTNIVVGVYDRSRLVATGRMSTTAQRTIDEYAILLGGLFERLQVPPASIQRILIVSVVPKATAGVKAALRLLCSAKPLVVGEDVPIPIRNLYTEPEQVGADRLVNAVAARKRRSVARKPPPWNFPQLAKSRNDGLPPRAAIAAGDSATGMVGGVKARPPFCVIVTRVRSILTVRSSTYGASTSPEAVCSTPNAT